MTNTENNGKVYYKLLFPTNRIAVVIKVQLNLCLAEKKEGNQLISQKPLKIGIGKSYLNMLKG